jgi:DNA transformation protein and related proteins
MSTQESTIEFILDQLRGVGEVRARKMFGEYALYCEDKVVGLVCNDQLFLKITETGRKFVGNNYKEGIAYNGAKPSMLIDGDLIEDHEWIKELVHLTADSLPVPKVKKKKSLQKQS